MRTRRVWPDYSGRAVFSAYHRSASVYLFGGVSRSAADPPRTGDSSFSSTLREYTTIGWFHAASSKCAAKMNCTIGLPPIGGLVAVHRGNGRIIALIDTIRTILRGRINGRTRRTQQNEANQQNRQSRCDVHFLAPVVLRVASLDYIKHRLRPRNSQIGARKVAP